MAHEPPTQAAIAAAHAELAPLMPKRQTGDATQATHLVQEIRQAWRTATDEPCLDSPPMCACTAAPRTYRGCACGGGWCPTCTADTCQCPWQDRPTAVPVQRRGADQDMIMSLLLHAVHTTLTDSSEPVGVIVGEYSGVIQAAYAARGINMLTVDWRPADSPKGLHYRGDAREVVFSRRWRLVIAHPWCRDLSRSGASKHVVKDAAGDVWRGLAWVLLWLCAPADAVLVEQPIGLFEVFYDAPVQTIQPWWFGDMTQKTWRLFHSDNVPAILPTNIVGGRCTKQHRQRIKDPVLREYMRSRTTPGLADGIAAQVQPALLPPRQHPPPVFHYEVQRMAATYELSGGTLPTDFARPLVAPTGDQALVAHHGVVDAARILAQPQSKRKLVSWRSVVVQDYVTPATPQSSDVSTTSDQQVAPDQAQSTDKLEIKDGLQPSAGKCGAKHSPAPGAQAGARLARTHTSRGTGTAHESTARIAFSTCIGY